MDVNLLKASFLGNKILAGIQRIQLKFILENYFGKFVDHIDKPRSQLNTRPFVGDFTTLFFSGFGYSSPMYMLKSHW